MWRTGTSSSPTDGSTARVSAPATGIAAAAFGAPRGKLPDAAPKAMPLRSSRRGNAADCPAPPEPSGRRRIANDLCGVARVRCEPHLPPRRDLTSFASRRRAATAIPAAGAPRRSTACCLSDCGPPEHVILRSAATKDLLRLPGPSLRSGESASRAWKCALCAHTFCEVLAHWRARRLTRPTLRAGHFVAATASRAEFGLRRSGPSTTPAPRARKPVRDLSELGSRSPGRLDPAPRVMACR
jgi:hypothetical protein